MSERERSEADPMSTLVVDWTACDGRGLCAELLLEVLELDPWGFPAATASARRGIPGALVDVPAGLEPEAKRAVRMCPRLALRLTGG